MAATVDMIKYYRRLEDDEESGDSTSGSVAGDVPEETLCGVGANVGDYSEAWGFRLTTMTFSLDETRPMTERDMQLVLEEMKNWCGEDGALSTLAGIRNELCSVGFGLDYGAGATPYCEAEILEAAINYTGPRALRRKLQGNNMSGINTRK